MLSRRQKNVPGDVAALSFLSRAMDTLDIEALFTDQDCNIILMNAAARSHLDRVFALAHRVIPEEDEPSDEEDSPGQAGSPDQVKLSDPDTLTHQEVPMHPEDLSAEDLSAYEKMFACCEDGFASIMPSLCRYCPNGKSALLESPADFVIQDSERTYYAVRYGSMEWIDGRIVTAIFLRNNNEERVLLDRLNHIAYVDQLTGVPNRRKLQEDFEAIADKISSAKVAGLLAIFDLDHFKTINDSYGHGTGDIMLKRLTGYFESVEAFQGHIYRLGGDEFVLLFADTAAKLSSQSECRRHYEGLLQEALQSYSLPNIDISCTLSMGVSFFPWHGDQYSELLRKADIALYKAKENGRNQIAFFEENDDTAKKFKDIFISIQPVLTAAGHTFGYELVDQEHDEALGETTLNLREYDRTVEALGIDELESNKWYFISFAGQLLNRSVANHLPRNKFVIQVHLSGRFSDQELEKCGELRALGYSLAFAGIDKSNASQRVFRLADYCKFDDRETDESFRRRVIGQYPSVKFIATGVDSLGAFERAIEQRYALFQGFFFNQPNQVKRTKDIDPIKANYLRLLRLSSTDDYVDFQEISAIISSDVALSYKLLRLLNSAAVGLRNRISSISMAVAYLGEVNLKQWIAMLALRGLSEDKPIELIRMSLIRAQLGESLCKVMTPKRDTKHVFLVGLLSLLDVALEKSKEEVFQEIPVADEIRDSLLTKEGPHSDLIRFFSDYEYAEWDAVSAFAANNRLTGNQVNNAYLAAVKWYNDLIDLE